MAQNAVVESVSRKNIGFKRTVVSQPIASQLLGAQHQNRLVSQLVVLDYCQCSEGFA